MPGRSAVVFVSALLSVWSRSLLGSDGSTSTFSVRVVARPKLPATERDLLPLDVRARRTDGQGEEVRASVSGASADGVAGELRLAAGVEWYVGFRKRGFWSYDKVVTAGSESRTVVVDVVRSGLVRLDLQVVGKEPRPDAVALRFRSDDTVPDGERIEPGVSSCAPTGEAPGAFVCYVPGGVLEVEVRAKGFAPVYRRLVRVAGGPAVNLGRVDLRWGASVSGLVRGAITKPGLAGPVVQIEASRSPGGPDGSAIQARPLMAVPDEKGFFQFVGLSPGRYVVTATQKGRSSARRTIDVRPELEAQINAPLVLQEPRDLKVQIVPSLDPGGAPWNVALGELDGSRLEPIGSGAASRAGEWSRSGLGLGRIYRLSVSRPGSRTTWRSETIDLDKAPSPLILDVSGEEITGTVRLGKEPLRATLLFGGTYGVESVALESDEAGLFRGQLPRLGPWDVSVAARVPHIDRRIRVTAQRSPAGGTSRVEINLPNAVVQGTIVDEHDRRVEEAILTIDHIDPLEQSEEIIVHGGEFRFDGQTPGRSTLSAAGRADGKAATSEPVAVILDEDRAAEPVRLVLKPASEVTGRILTGGGLGISGAQVFPFEVGTGLQRGYPFYSDADGRFVVRFGSQARALDVVVMAPGQARTFFRVAVPRGEPLDVIAQPVGGELVIRREWSAPFPQPERIFLVRDGAVVDPQLLAYPDGDVQVKDGAVSRIAIRNLEAGNYSACSVTLGEFLRSELSRCATASLSPGGTAELLIRIKR